MIPDFLTPQRLEFRRRPAVEEAIASTKSDIYRKVGAGLFPPPIKLAQRQSVWLAHEIDLWQRFAAAGAAPAQLQELVAALVAARPRLTRTAPPPTHDDCPPIATSTAKKTQASAGEMP